MLSCIMRQQENVFTQHFAGNMVLSLDSNNLSLSKVSLWFSSVYGKMPLNTFVTKFNDHFGCKIENYKFAEKLKSANVWDDIVTDSMDEICRHYGIENIRLHDIDKQWGHPSVQGMQSIDAQVWESVSPILEASVSLPAKN